MLFKLRYVLFIVVLAATCGGCMSPCTDRPGSAMFSCLDRYCYCADWANCHSCVNRECLNCNQQQCR